MATTMHSLPVAMLGHNMQFGWSLTMLENDDIDLIAEKLNPANPNQVWYQGQWVESAKPQRNHQGQRHGACATHA
jgi:penicillin amidase